MSNEYRMTWNPNDKDAMLTTPGAGLTLYERMGLANKDDRIYRGLMGRPGMDIAPPKGTSKINTSKINMFERIRQMQNLQKAPAAKFE